MLSSYTGSVFLASRVDAWGFIIRALLDNTDPDMEVTELPSLGFKLYINYYIIEGATPHKSLFNQRFPKGPYENRTFEALAPPLYKFKLLKIWKHI